MVQQVLCDLGLQAITFNSLKTLGSPQRRFHTKLVAKCAAQSQAGCPSYRDFKLDIRMLCVLASCKCYGVSAEADME